mmetsp:Transcript_524/g.824  ORF Transcript_524/g.824 Transcript_524/m.824 type:complete len:233 (+) Transcript_524:446-1144(+)
MPALHASLLVDVTAATTLFITAGHWRKNCNPSWCAAMLLNASSPHKRSIGDRLSKKLAMPCGSGACWLVKRLLRAAGARKIIRPSKRTTHSRTDSSQHGSVKSAASFPGTSCWLSSSWPAWYDPKASMSSTALSFNRISSVRKAASTLLKQPLSSRAGKRSVSETRPSSTKRARTRIRCVSRKSCKRLWSLWTRSANAVSRPTGHCAALQIVREAASAVPISSCNRSTSTSL